MSKCLRIQGYVQREPGNIQWIIDNCQLANVFKLKATFTDQLLTINLLLKNAVFLPIVQYLGIKFALFCGFNSYFGFPTAMLKRERQAFIVQKVNLHNKVLSASLSSEINVSEDTIRRDLQELSECGKLIKVYGGALSRSFNDINYYSSRVYARAGKQCIAGKAVSLISDGMFVLTGGGTTILELARSLPPELSATFISGSIPAIVEYMQHPNIEVIVVGDKLSKSSKITAGADAISRIRSLKPDLCILGVNAIDLHNGITDNDWDVAQLKKAMIEASKKLVCLSISEKVNTVQAIPVCSLQEIDVMVTELEPGSPLLKPYAEAGITIL